MPALGQLPTELLIVVFEHLDPKSLLVAATICRLWNTLTRSPNFQYKVLLHRYSMVDGPADAAWPVSRRLESLRAFYARFSTLRWYKSYRIAMDPTNLWELFSGVYAQAAMDENFIKFRQGLSPTLLTREKTWTIRVPVDIRDFSMDSFQDLAVVVASGGNRNTRPMHHIHFLSMADGQPHKLAKVPLFSEESAVGRDAGCGITIQNQHIGILFMGSDEAGVPSSELFIWNWKEGKRCFHLNSEGGYLLETFCFLSPQHVMVASRDRNPFNGGPTLASSLDVYDYSQSSDEVVPHRFLLPRGMNGMALDIDISCEAVPELNKDVGRPFYTSPHQRICVVSFFLFPGFNTGNVIFFTSSLLDYMREEPDMHIIPWNHWGNKTRVTGWRRDNSVYKIRTSGTRVVRFVPGNGPRVCNIQVCDFNPYAIPEQEKLEHVKQRYVEGPTDEVLIQRGILDEPISSQLPYLETTTKGSFRHKYVMIDHENIYLLGNSVSQSPERELEVLSF